jgi:ATP-dependent Lhr-like helicase
MLQVEPGKVRVEDAPGTAAEHPFLARRGAGAQRRTVARGVAAARGEANSMTGIDPRAALADRYTAAAERPPRGNSSPITSRRCTCRARRAADAATADPRALLRRIGRHAARHPRAVRQPHQPRVGARAAQALLPQVQLRAAGRGDRGQHRALARHRRTVFPLAEVAGYLRAHNAREMLVQALLAAPMFGARWRWVRNTALAVPRQPRRQARAGAVAARGCRGSDRAGVPGPARLRWRISPANARFPITRW